MDLPICHLHRDPGWPGKERSLLSACFHLLLNEFVWLLSSRVQLHLHFTGNRLEAAPGIQSGKCCTSIVSDLSHGWIGAQVTHRMA